MINLQKPFLVEFESKKDSKGRLAMLDDTIVPFKILRTFWLSDVPENTHRGGHAHHSSQQLLVCLEGLIEAQIEEVTGQTYQFQLNRSTHGLYLPPLCWGVFAFHQKAIALGLASDYFNEADYIRDYSEFETLKNASKNG